MSTTLNMTIQLRRAAFEDTCVLAAGEPGFHTATKEFKVGDGVTQWSQLPFANKAQIEALIKVVDDKVAALGDTYATDAEVEVIRKSLADRLDSLEATAKTFGDIITHDVDEFATSEQGAKADATAATIATYGDIVTKNTSDFDAAGAASAVEGKLDEYKTSNDAAVALKADKSVVEAMYTNTQIDNLVQGAKDYADSNDANTTYTIGYESKVDGDGGHPARIVLTPSEGEATYVDATPFIKDGMLDNVTYNDTTNTLTFTFNTDAGKEAVEVQLTDILAPYVGSTGDRIKVTVADGVISADVVEGSIAKTYLSTDVQTSLGKADTALQEHQDISHLATEADLTLAEGRITDLEGKPAAEITAEQITNWDGEVGAKALAETKTTTAEVKDQIEAYNYATETSAQDKADKALADAKAYADSKEHKNTTYTAAPTANTLEFTLTPSEGEAQTVKLVAPTVDVGVTKVTAGDDIVVTPAEGTGNVTVAHKEYATGAVTIKDKDGNTPTTPYYLNALTLTNGHVTGATAQSLAEALQSMTFILDGGISAT